MTHIVFLATLATFTPADVAMTAAQERMVADWSGRPAEPPEPARSLLATMRSGCYVCRRWATLQFREASRADLRWAMAGTADDDPEIRWRCWWIIRNPPGSGVPCKTCGGRALPRQDLIPPGTAIVFPYNQPPYCLACGWGAPWWLGDPQARLDEPPW